MIFKGRVQCIQFFQLFQIRIFTDFETQLMPFFCHFIHDINSITNSYQPLNQAMNMIRLNTPSKWLYQRCFDYFGRTYFLTDC